jgi:hypothetical protein
MFVVAMLDGLRNGTFLEIGGYHPVNYSNTYLLEKHFDWAGTSIDIIDSGQKAWQEFYNNIKDVSWPSCPTSIKDLPIHIQQELQETHNHDRHVHPNSWPIARPCTSFICADAVDYDYLALPRRFDYLQIDIDPPTGNLNVLKKIVNTHRFSVVTFEHDAWRNTDETKQVMHESRKIFQQNGYELVVNNVTSGNSNFVFEDWYVDPTVVPKHVVDVYRSVDHDMRPKSQQYILYH